MEKIDWAIVFGKFKPPHIGHEYLIRLALGLADHVTVFVGNPFQPPDAMRAELRADWLRAHFGPAIDVVVPPEGDMSTMDASEVAAMGMEFFKHQFGDRRPDLVVGADAHTVSFAQLAGCKALVSDTVLIRATEIRADPMLHWDKILPAARPFFLRETLVIGSLDALDRAADIAQSGGVFTVRCDQQPPGYAAAQVEAARHVASRHMVACLKPEQLASVVERLVLHPRAHPIEILLIGIDEECVPTCSADIGAHEIRRLPVEQLREALTGPLVSNDRVKVDTR